MVFATNETCSNCYLIVFYLDDSTTAAAYIGTFDDFLRVGFVLSWGGFWV